MSQKFKFDEATGTMVVIDDSNMTPLTVGTPPPPVSSPDNQKFLKFVRTENPTAVCLLDANGNVESFLDSSGQNILMFRDGQDYDIYQITDERSGQPLAFIGGFALQIKFNMAELRTMERVEQCVQGIANLFRDKIMNQNIGNAK